MVLHNYFFVCGFPVFLVPFVEKAVSSPIEWPCLPCWKLFWGISLVVQRLGLHASTAGDMGSIPGRGTKILQAACFVAWPKRKENLHVCARVFFCSFTHNFYCIYALFESAMFSQQLHDLSSYLVVPLDLINCLTVAPKFPHYFVSWCCLLLSFSFKEMDWINVVRCTYWPKWGGGWVHMDPDSSPPWAFHR